METLFLDGIKDKLACGLPVSRSVCASSESKGATATLDSSSVERAARVERKTSGLHDCNRERVRAK